MLVYVRPSNEHILIARVPGAQDQHGCPLPILPSSLVISSGRVACLIFHCARPFVLFFPVQCSAKQGREEFLTAAVERGPSEGARSGSKKSSSCPCASPFHHARSASRRITRQDGWSTGSGQ
jgi:hypothetical protein